MARIKSTKSNKLSFTQGNILNALEKHAGKVVSARALAKVVWKGKLPESWSTMLSTEIQHIRRAIGAKKWQLVNVHGRGYSLGCDVIHAV